MKASEELMKALKGFEGCKLFAYRDSVGVPTIGYGHTGADVRMGMAITQKQADELLRKDLAKFEQYVDGLGLDLCQSRFDALVDFCFNLGTGNLAGSTLLKKVKAHAPVREVQNEFRKWVYAGGKKLQGLVKRREWEAQMWAK